MTSTWSPNLRIELMGDGDQPGQWGTTTNRNLNTVLESAITGVQSVVMVDATRTLSFNNGIADESRNAVLVVTGANLAIRAVVAPLVQKTYTVTNSTTGGFAITIGASTGTTVTIPNGATAQVYCDGSTGFRLISSTIPNANTAMNSTKLTGLTAGTTSGDSVEYAQLNTAISAALTTEHGQLQTQTYTAVTTTGGPTAFAATASPAISGAVTTNTRLRLKFNVTSSGTPTLVLGTTTAALQQYDSTGTLVAATLGSGQLTDVEYNGSVYVVLDPLTPVITPPNQIQPFTATTTTNALTGVYAASTLAYRSATATLGTPITLANGSLSLTIPATSNLGMVLTAQVNRLIWLVAYNAGTPVLCVVNLAGGNSLDETGFISPTTIGAASNTANVIYSASSVSAGSPYRVIGFTDVIFTTGTGWSSPTLVQGQGGQALAAMSSLGYGQTWQNVTVSRVSGTTYYNTTGKPIICSGTNAGYGGAGGSGVEYTINGVAFSAGGGVKSGWNFIVPTGHSYSVTPYITAFLAWNELR